MIAFIAGVHGIMTAELMLAVFIGTLLGIVVGALPGLSGSTTSALLLPLTVTMSPITAIAFLGAIYCAANYGGSITAILINTPGDPSASATAFDGYPMAARGEAGRALGMSAVSSAIGGIFSVLVLVVATPLLSRFAYSFGPPEYFALAVFGLSMIGAVGGAGALKSLIAGCMGVLLACVGMDLTTGVERFTFGLGELTDGISFVPVLTGLFAVAELIEQASRLDEKLVRLPMAAARLPSAADFRKSAKSITLGSVLGTFIGVLPALGATTAALLTYNEVRRVSRYKHEFGKGAIEGIAGPEAANNSAVGGSMVPTLALGIPGSATTAIILAGLLVQGVRPGPHLFNEQPQFLYAVFGSMLAANLIFLVLGLVLAKLFAMITLIPNALLWPGVLFCSVIGAYAPNQSMGDVWTMLAFGVIGFLFRRHGFSPAPLVMGLVLGQMVEESLKQSLIIFDQRWAGFLERPVALTLLVVTITLLLLPALARGIRAMRAKGA